MRNSKDFTGGIVKVVQAKREQEMAEPKQGKPAEDKEHKEHKAPETNTQQHVQAQGKPTENKEKVE